MSWSGRIVLAAAVPALAGCGGGPDDLSRDAVSSIPSGSAKGSAFAGQYRTSRITRSCDGQCPRIVVGIFSASTCDIGFKQDDTIDVAQVDGRLDVDLNG